MASELQRLSDPNYAISLAVGPPFPDLKPQQPGSGLILSNQCSSQPRRFVFKKAHLSRDDFRIFDGSSGRPVAVLHHFGKNPYEKLDPLSLGNFSDAHQHMLGEWESVCTVTGYNGMPSLKIRPKGISRHGRQNVYDGSGQRHLFNIGKESKLKAMALRSNLAVRGPGDNKDVLYRVLPDLMGRTLQIVTPNDELVCFVQKSTKALIQEAALGSGSEMMIDVAPGVDWSAMIAVIMAVQQVGAHFVKDALGNFVLDPLKDSAVQAALQGSGMDGVANSAGSNIDGALQFVRKMQMIQQMFAQ